MASPFAGIIQQVQWVEAGARLLSACRSRKLPTHHYRPMPQKQKVCCTTMQDDSLLVDRMEDVERALLERYACGFAHKFVGKAQAGAVGEAGSFEWVFHTSLGNAD